MTVDDLQQRHDDALGAVLDTAKAVAERVRRLAVDGDGTDDTPAQQLGRLETAARSMHETAQAVAAMLGPSAGDAEQGRKLAALAEVVELVEDRVATLEQQAEPPGKG